MNMKATALTATTVAIALLPSMGETNVQKQTLNNYLILKLGMSKSIK